MSTSKQGDRLWSTTTDNVADNSVHARLSDWTLIGNFVLFIPLMIADPREILFSTPPQSHWPGVPAEEEDALNDLRPGPL